MTLGTYETLLLEPKGRVLLVSVNRPKKLNALAEAVLVDLSALLEELAAVDGHSYRGVVLTGAGEKAFIAGADIAAMDKMSAREARAYGAMGQRVTLQLEKLPLPVLAAVNGYALGGGCEMAMACDMIYASANAVFGQPEINLGLIPGFGGTQRLRRYVGPAFARELIYSGRNVPADEALRIGLTQRVLPDKAALLEAALTTMETIAARPPRIVAQCKRVFGEGESTSLEHGLAIENRGFGDVFETPERQEGTNAFLEKRPAQF